MTFLEVVAPFQIAGAAGRIAGARRRPALDVLPAHGDPQQLRRVRSERRECIAHALAVQEFRRYRAAVDLYAVRSARICIIDRGNDIVETLSVAAHGTPEPAGHSRRPGPRPDHRASSRDLTRG